MKKSVLLIFLIVCINQDLVAESPVNENDSSAEDESITKRTIKTVTKSVISVGKDIFSGFSDGVDNGRQATDGTDGAMVISDINQLNENLEVKVLEAKQGDSINVTVVLLGFKNKKDKAVRIINLNEKDNLLLIDKEGYSTRLKANSTPPDITIPANSAIRTNFNFTGDLGSSNLVRIFQTDYKILKKDFAVPVKN